MLELVDHTVKPFKLAPAFSAVLPETLIMSSRPNSPGDPLEPALAFIPLVPLGPRIGPTASRPIRPSRSMRLVSSPRRNRSFPVSFQAHFCSKNC